MFFDSLCYIKQTSVPCCCWSEVVYIAACLYIRTLLMLIPGTTFSTILPAYKYKQAENNDVCAKDELCECTDKHPFFLLKAFKNQ